MTISGAERQRRYRARHPRPSQATGALKGPSPVHPFTRVMRRVDVTDGCWFWQGSKDARTGYGAVGIGSNYDGTKRNMKVHRLVYEVMVGPIPDGQTLDHLCKVRHCVRAEHLEPVTLSENIRRGDSPSSRHREVTHCPNGHPYDEANTRITPRGTRDCRACDRGRRRSGAVA